MRSIMASWDEWRAHTEGSYLIWVGNDDHVAADLASNALCVSISRFLFSCDDSVMGLHTVTANLHRRFVVLKKAQAPLPECQ